MTPKDASTIKARKTSTESAASPQTVKIATGSTTDDHQIAS